MAVIPAMEATMQPILSLAPPPLLPVLIDLMVSIYITPARGVCVVFTYSKISSQTANKEKVNEQPMKASNDVVCFRVIDTMVQKVYT